MMHICVTPYCVNGCNVSLTLLALLQSRPSSSFVFLLIKLLIAPGAVRKTATRDTGVRRRIPSGVDRKGSFTLGTESSAADISELPDV